MLSRAADRKHAYHRLCRSYDRLVLPWLCPAIQRSQLTTRCRQNRVGSKIGPALQQGHSTTRSLATIKSASLYDPKSSYIPFEGMDAYGSLKEPEDLPSQFTSRPPLSDPSDPLDRDASSVIILNPLLSSKPPSVRKIRSIGGDLDEMLINFDVSLSAGMFKRAGLLIRRLAAAYPHNSSELLDLHNKYLRSMVTFMVVNRQPQLVWYAQRWFEVDMKLLSVEPNTVTFAWMLRMSLRMLVGQKRDRTVRRYWRLASRRGITEDILQSSILPESDLGSLSQICFQKVKQSVAEDTASDLESPEDRSDFNLDVNDNTVLPPNVIRSTTQKGLGLSSLKESLSLFDVPENNKTEGRRYGHDLKEDRQRQAQLEKNSLSSAIERWHKENEKAMKHGSYHLQEAKLGAFLYRWYEGVLAKIKSELDQANDSESKIRLTIEESERNELSPFLQAVGPNKLAAITILSVLGSLGNSGMDKGIKLSSLFTNLGRSIHEEYVVEQTQKSLLEETVDTNRKYVKKMFKEMKVRNSTSQFKTFVRKYSEDKGPIAWPTAIEIKIGALLASMLFSTAEVQVIHKDSTSGASKMVSEPAFQHVYQLRRGHNIGFVRLHQKVVEKLKREPAGYFLAKSLPMVCKPKSWTSVKGGGFLTQPVQIARLQQDDIQSQYLEVAAARGDLDDIYNGLNILGKTGWKINKPVFDVMLEAWNSEEEVANIVPANLDIPEPQKPDTDDPKVVKAYYQAKERYDNKKMSYHSQRCFLNFQMEIAKAYIPESFYLPHNMDFRGRAYPLPPYFNQMGADNCRGLLLFSEGRALGERGLSWLKVHLANVFGYDKASFTEREQFSNDHIEDILDSANNGLGGRRWWLKAADPFQCLAACMELRDALKLEDPTQYVSHLPIHQDGSCNGLQHYAALGGDTVGARQVNLEPGDRPSDIYTAVSEHVKRTIEIEAGQGDLIAQTLLGKVTRKVVKQTVMTNVYGVTFIGATRQVRRQLEDHYPELAESDMISKCAIYVAKAIFAALNSMFTGAHDIQFWLGDSASRITRSMSPAQIEDLQTLAISSSKNDKGEKLNFKNSVAWTTPLKLPVVQPYREATTRHIQTSLQTCTIKDYRGSETVNRRKQLQAFPPNFIHSLDATHMMLSAIKCDELGLKFSAVHDSFWTHGADVDTMNRVLRDAFIRMHSDDIIGRLAAEFRARYGGSLYLAQVKANSAVAKAIKKFRKAKKVPAKNAKTTELAVEYERMMLLGSNDPAEQEKGKNMETAGSIFADLGNGEESLVSTRSLGVAGMSHVPPSESQENIEATLNTEEYHHQHSVVSGVDQHSIHDAEESDAEMGVTAAKGKKATKSTASCWVWLPLTFLPVPPKGDFDVSRLKDSQYFFS